MAEREGSGTVVVRTGIRWLPDPQSELTSTLVLTSPGKHFVDIRIRKTAAGDNPDSLWCDHLYAPLDQGSYRAFAGTSSYTQSLSTGHSSEHSLEATPVGHGIWHHWVDTHVALKDTPEPDEGDLFAYAPDDRPHDQVEYELEKGTMTNPDTGRRQAYEEIWANVTPVFSSRSPAKCNVYCVLKTREEDQSFARGLVVRVGSWCQGMLRQSYPKDTSRETNIAERWAFENGKWRCLFSAEALFGALPTVDAMHLDDNITENSADTQSAFLETLQSSVERNGLIWTVAEIGFVIANHLVA